MAIACSSAVSRNSFAGVICDRAMVVKRILHCALIINFITVPIWAGTIMELPVGTGGTVNYRTRGPHAVIGGWGIKIGDLSYGLHITPILRGRLLFKDKSFAGSHAGTMSWGAGGTFTIRGCADLNGDSRCGKGDYRGKLMTGSFVSAGLVEQDGKEVLIAKIVDELSPELAALLHLPDIDYSGKLELFMLSSANRSRWCLRDPVQSGLLQNFGPGSVPTVPEPASIVIACLSLVLVGLIRLSSARRLRRRTEGSVI